MKVSVVNSAGDSFCWNYATDTFYGNYAGDNICCIYAGFEVVLSVTGMLVVQLSLNSGSAQVQTLLAASRRFAMVRISDNGAGWK